MAYTHLTTKELTWIENYYEIGEKAYIVAKKLRRSAQTIYNVYHYLDDGGTIIDYYEGYKANKSKCGSKKKQFTEDQITYINDRVSQGWSPDVIIGRQEIDLNCCAKTLYRRFQDDPAFDVRDLPMQGKRKANHHVETRGRLNDRRRLEQRQEAYPEYNEEFGHFEGDTIVGKNHQSAAITLVERISKLAITLKTEGRKACQVTDSLRRFFLKVPYRLVKSLTLDNGKEFSNWKDLSNEFDIDIFFADPGCPSQRGLNEHTNGLLRRDGLPKGTDFNEVDEDFLKEVTFKRNIIPRKSLNYYTPLEVFLAHLLDQTPGYYANHLRNMVSSST
ncbi:IS30 family transposase [Suicoccus acidiformans]|uniref:IS30 family transposase n=1 Tax=Suicoccus acidiformans TaxID=2036206 RepID=A0A347WLH7_9LACT|nr:IS30 family transposase [Suicoccus acidiformans]AXY25934.1 IS30 family transposase [Suicoccus acidiformans]